MKIAGHRVATLILVLAAVGFSVPVRAQTKIIPRATRPQVQRLANWLLSHRGAESGLPVSHVGDARFKDWCFTYDAAVAALAFIALDRPGEAERIIDFYITSQNARRLGGVIEAVLVVPPYAGKDWSVRTGANIWLGLASYHLFRSTQAEKYLTFATRIADFALGLQDRDNSSPTYGGMKLGPPGDAAFDGDQHFGYDSHLPGFEQIFATEATIDAFALFDLLQHEPGMGRFKSGRDLCLHWLKKVAWNPGLHRFNRGFHQKPDLTAASDIHAWGISALGVARLDAIEPGAAEQMVRFVEEHCQSTVFYRSPDGREVTVSGFDFVDHEALTHLKRPPLISPEWTFQMANAYGRLSDDFEAAGKKSKASLYAQKRRHLLTQVMAMATTRDNASGLPYASLGDVPVGHENNTPAQGSFSTIGVAYGILALTGYDPLRFPGER
ncbi:MAG: hypothetical protein KQI81_20870 [Deltaproteobacteria bacterium]|nr:hypothetical protein [Deltaproteobacteria bacterium]